MESEEVIDAVVVAKRPLSSCVVLVTLRAAPGGTAPPWDAGAHVDLLLPEGRVRQYSLCGDPQDRTELNVAVLREPLGRGGSLYVYDELEVGTRLEVRGPRNHFRLDRSPSYLFIAGGIGITPILPMISQAEAAGAEWSLLYCGRSRGSMAFLDVLAGYGDRVSVVAEDERGRPDFAAALRRPRPDTAIYCCGPEGMLLAVEERCASWPPASLHVERFTPRDAGAPTEEERSFEVVLQRSGKSVTVAPDRSILDAVRDLGTDVLSSCQEGTCGTCETDVVEGIPDHRDSILTPLDRAANDCMMICCSRSMTPRLVLDL